MPLSIKIPAGQDIEVLGVTLRAVSSCKVSLDDKSFKFIPATPTSPRRIVSTAGTE